MIWKQQKLQTVRHSLLTIGGRSWWVWWGRKWRGRPEGRGSLEAAHWPRRQPVGCSSSSMVGGASGPEDGLDWLLPPWGGGETWIFFPVHLIFDHGINNKANKLLKLRKRKNASVVSPAVTLMFVYFRLQCYRASCWILRHGGKKVNKSMQWAVCLHYGHNGKVIFHFHCVHIVC